MGSPKIEDQSSEKLGIENLVLNENDDALNNTLTFIVSYDEHLTNAEDSTGKIQ